MAGTQRLLAIALAYSLAGHPNSSKAETLGIVVQADHALLGSQEASEGTTIYDGDRLSTKAAGSLRLRVGEALIYLVQESSVIVHNEAGTTVKEFAAELIAGTVLLSMTKADLGEIVASEAHVRPISETRGVVQVRLLGPYELVVFAQQGPAQISYRGETETIPEGKSYRVLLNAAQDGGAGGSIAKQPTKRNKKLLLIPVGVGIMTGIILRELLEGGTAKGMESPDRP